MPLPAEEIEAEKQGTVLSRRSFIGAALGTAIGGACTLLLGGCAAGTDDGERQVNILNWADYLHPDAISEFERRYKI
ncbi:MAG: hypothetical protein JSS86_16665, partial [Cyanobacteria bacterium SZAS LIN-2]|nr:hypothetical protein [Cyanobacteria bacterium SZAS LIN-2]